MTKTLGENLKRLAAACPYPLYVVGGRVRDFLAGLSCVAADTDICAPAAAEDFAARAAECGFSVDAVYAHTGTVKISLGEESYEYASFRTDEYVRGEHSPEKTCFTCDIALDARRRDFRCNAVYYDIKGEKFVDPLGGAADIEARRLSAVADPRKVFGEDGLRLMRLARIAGQTGFKPTEDTLSAARENAELISDVSPERIAAELDLILEADARYGVEGGHYVGLEILDETLVLDRIMPELTAGRGMAQREDFHSHDVLEHSLRCALYAPRRIRLAALLHDVGKPYCMRTRGAFACHGEEGARIAEEILSRLKFSKKRTAETVRLVATHMYDLRGDARENKVRKFILANADIFGEILALKQADYSACKDDLSTAPAVIKFRAIYGKMKAEGVPFSLKELKIRGGALLELGFPPETVGKTLGALLEDCCVGAARNLEEELLARARKVYLPRAVQK